MAASMRMIEYVLTALMAYQLVRLWWRLNRRRGKKGGGSESRIIIRGRGIRNRRRIPEQPLQNFVALIWNTSTSYPIPDACRCRSSRLLQGRNAPAQGLFWPYGLRSYPSNTNDWISTSNVANDGAKSSGAALFSAATLSAK
jgi:hypothetical protein